MQSIKVKIKRMPHFCGELPKYESAAASGFDIRARIDAPITLKPRERFLIPTGLAFSIPSGYELQVRPRSGLALKHGISLVNTPGTIDADYRGEIKVILINLGEETISIRDQDRIAQLILCPVYRAEFSLVEELDQSERLEKGFGSTGV